jgi:hypothetical protein
MTVAIAMMIEAANTSESSVKSCHTAHRYNLHDRHLQFFRNVQTSKCDLSRKSHMRVAYLTFFVHQDGQPCQKHSWK